LIAFEIGLCIDGTKGSGAVEVAALLIISFSNYKENCFQKLGKITEGLIAHLQAAKNICCHYPDH
jgi:hypothetical protein